MMGFFCIKSKPLREYLNNIKESDMVNVESVGSAKITKIALPGLYVAKQQARETLYRDCGYQVNLNPVPDVQTFTIGFLDRIVKDGGNLTFDQVYAGMFLVLAATNKLIEIALRDSNPNLPTEEALKYKAASFLQLMATKEALVSLTAEEIAGCVAAVLHDTVPLNLTNEPIIETCGMGGDRGIKVKERFWKTINISTLSSFVVAALGYPVIKHGSYGNTTPVGSTDALILLGIETTQSGLAQIEEIFAATGFYYADAHNTKTVHDISHFLGHETINHIIGPMTLPIRRGAAYHKVMGVNEKVDPETIGLTYEQLVRLGLLNLRNGAIVAGIDERLSRRPDKSFLREHTVIDELSPLTSVVTLIKNGQVFNHLQLGPEDFGAELTWDEILINSDPEWVKVANLAAISPSSSSPLQKYLAMNAALVLAVSLDLEDCAGETEFRSCLRTRYEESLEAIRRGTVADFVENYTLVSNRVHKQCS